MASRERMRRPCSLPRCRMISVDVSSRQCAFVWDFVARPRVPLSPHVQPCRSRYSNRHDGERARATGRRRRSSRASSRSPRACSRRATRGGAVAWGGAKAAWEFARRRRDHSEWPSLPRLISISRYRCCFAYSSSSSGRIWRAGRLFFDTIPSRSFTQLSPAVARLSLTVSLNSFEF